jgi:Fe-S-cluster containining protein
MQELPSIMTLSVAATASYTFFCNTSAACCAYFAQKAITAGYIRNLSTKYKKQGSIKSFNDKANNRKSLRRKFFGRHFNAIHSSI